MLDISTRDELPDAGFDKAISTTMVWYITRKWGEFTGIGKVSPHDLRRTAVTRALDKGLTYRQVQMMSGHKDPKMVMATITGEKISNKMPLTLLITTRNNEI